MDTILDTFQDFVANPSPYMEAFGVRAKRHTESENLSGFKTFPIPFAGIEVGVKHRDESNPMKGGEAFLHVDDLQSLVPAAHSKQVKLHMKFNGGASTTDGLFNAEIDYHLEHKDGDGVEEGSMTVVREMRAGKWHTTIKTEAHPFSGVPIIPKRISNMQFDIESDRKTTFNAKYFNGPMKRDFKVDVVRVPGKSIKAIFYIAGQPSTIEGTLTKPSANEIDIKINGDILGQKITGTISAKMQPGKPSNVQVDIKKGAESVFQMQLQVKTKGMQGKFRGKYSVMGGKVAQGEFTGEYGNGKFVFEGKPYKLAVTWELGKMLEIQATKDGVEMWSYHSLRQDKSTASDFIYEAESVFNMNPASKLYSWTEKHYPFGAFMKRTNTIRMYVDKNNKNSLFNKFKFDFDVTKDGVKVIHIIADTTGTPYMLTFDAPNFFKKMNLPQQTRTLSVNHQKGKSLSVAYNGLGGLKLDINHQPNSQGGRAIDVLATKAGDQMFKYHGDTSKINNAAMLKVGLKGEFNLSPKSLLYKMIVSKYQILTPFSKRTSEFEFFWDKKNKNTVMNKFYVKGKIDKDDTNVMNVDITTNEKPYKFHVFVPAVLSKVNPGMEAVDLIVDHNPGQSLEVKFKCNKCKKFKIFKITKTGNGNERDIEWNGKKLAKSDYSLTDTSFQTTNALADGKSLTTTITWKNKFGSPQFFLDNKVHVNLDGTERKLDMNMEWDMAKVPDMDFRTPENIHMKMTAVGNNKRWGDYSVAREATLSSRNGVLGVDVAGKANFAAGPLASKSPIDTDVKLSYNVKKTDLVGTFKKVMAGKEYSITFPAGSFKMPSIKIGA